MSRVALVGRLVDQLGAPLTGSVQAITAAGDQVSAILAPDGSFSLDLPAAAALTVVDPAGGTYSVSTSSPPTVAAQAGQHRLLVDYAGDPTMQGQTPETMAAQARKDAAAAQQVTGALQSLMSTMTATLQTVLGSVSAQAARQPYLAVGRAALPNLAAGVARDVAVAWSVPVAPSSAVALLEPTGSLLGQASAQVKAGSLARSGCTVTVTSPVLLAAGAGNVVAVAAYLP